MNTYYFATRNGKVLGDNDCADRRKVQMYVNRNNASAQRGHGEIVKPYALVAYVVPTA